MNSGGCSWTPSQLGVQPGAGSAPRRHDPTTSSRRHQPFTAPTWTQAIVATAEGSLNGVRVRQFSPTELLAFYFAFDVPIGWFFMPPPEPGATTLRMPNQPGGVEWRTVYARTAPTASNIDAYLLHQHNWPRIAHDAFADAVQCPIDETNYRQLLHLLRHALLPSLAADDAVAELGPLLIRLATLIGHLT
jgi:hypothetical protein